MSNSDKLLNVITQLMLSAAYINHISMASFTNDNKIKMLMYGNHSVLICPKVITFSGFYYYYFA